MADSEKDEAGALGCVALLASPLAWWLWAVTATACWQWFVLPMFPSAPNPNRAQAAGLLVTWYAIRGAPYRAKDTRTPREAVMNVIGREFVGPLLTLLCAFVIKRWWL